ncbi:MAG: MdsD protein, partial [Flavobacteriaceae bacterium]|nr:MdsD protein [Flavobacteriaceae bacterium]
MAFTYQGDIWTYNFAEKQMKRLTVHEGYDHSPIWKPDGSALAFSSNRYGNTNLFLINSNGGSLNQLTYYPSSDIAYSWNKDNQIIFQTNRITSGPEWDAQTYSISSKGGTPTKIMEAYGTAATISPNGRWIAFVRGACRISREDYKGPANKDIWIYNTESKTYHQITKSKKNEHSPKWDANNNLYFIGASSGRYNIYKHVIQSSGKVQGPATPLSNHTENGVVEFSVANNGDIVYHNLFHIYHLKNGNKEKLVLQLDSDNRFDDLTAKT